MLLIKRFKHKVAFRIAEYYRDIESCETDQKWP
jgi:hypothetical protein